MQILFNFAVVCKLVPHYENQGLLFAFIALSLASCSNDARLHLTKIPSGTHTGERRKPADCPHLISTENGSLANILKNLLDDKDQLFSELQ